MENLVLMILFWSFCCNSNYGVWYREKIQTAFRDIWLQEVLEIDGRAIADWFFWFFFPLRFHEVFMLPMKLIVFVIFVLWEELIFSRLYSWYFRQSCLIFQNLAEEMLQLLCQRTSLGFRYTEMRYLSIPKRVLWLSPLLFPPVCQTISKSCWPVGTNVALSCFIARLNDLGETICLIFLLWLSFPFSLCFFLVSYLFIFSQHCSFYLKSQKRENEVLQMDLSLQLARILHHPQEWSQNLQCSCQYLS